MKYCKVQFVLLLSLASCLYAKEFRTITTEYNPNLGMFASANQVLGQLYLYESGQLPDVSGLMVDFEQYGLYYDPSYGPNWWSYYFEPIRIGDEAGADKVYTTREEYVTAWEQRRKITREIAADIIARHVHIKPHVLDKVNDFISRFFQDRYVIGIHYRGTDKKKEAPKINYDAVFAKVAQHIPKDRPYSIFIATDETEFLKQARKKFVNHVVATDAHRAHINGGAVHFSYKNNYSIGEEALIDACLLSKCDLLIRTSSNLSLWSTYFNPQLPVILLTQRFIETLEPE
jgi:hypothetical protein